MKVDVVKRSDINTQKSKYNEVYAKLENLADEESLKIEFKEVFDSNKFYHSFANCLRSKKINKVYTMHRDGLDVYISKRRSSAG